MANNLKVNFKTKIGEFKRKHNGIVDLLEQIEGNFLGDLEVTDNVISIPENSGLYFLIENDKKVGIIDIKVVNAQVGSYQFAGFYKNLIFDGTTPSGAVPVTSINLFDNKYVKIPSMASQQGKFLKVNALGNLEWAEISGGTKLYKHDIVLDSDGFYHLILVSPKSTPYSDDFEDDNVDSYENLIKDCITYGCSYQNDEDDITDIVVRIEVEAGQNHEVFLNHFIVYVNAQNPNGILDKSQEELLTEFIIETITAL